MLGSDIPISRAVEVLSSLGFETTAGANSSVTVRPPYWRSDVTLEDDLVEEVARVIGYDEMPVTMLSAPIPHQRPRPTWELKERIRDMLVAAGMREIITYNVVSEDSLRVVGEWREDSLSLANPMNEELRYLRTTLRASMLQTVSENRRLVGEEGLRLFELGRIFLPAGSKAGDLPQEREMLTVAFCGRRYPHWWHGSDGGSSMDFFDAKGVTVDTLRRLGIEPALEPADDPALIPGRSAAIVIDGQRAGTLGEIDPSVLGAFDMDGTTIALAEIEVSAVLSAMPLAEARYRPFSRYPESVRDLALVVDADVSAERIRGILAEHKLVKAAIARDVYTGKGGA